MSDAFGTGGVGSFGLGARQRRYARPPNDITAKKSTAGSVAVQFGGCDAKMPNCLLIIGGWNYAMRGSNECL